MGFLLLAICLIGCFQYTHKALKVDYSIAIPFATACILSLLFIAALLNCFLVSCYSIYGFGALCFIGISTQHFLRYRISKSLLSKELWVLILVIVLIYLRVGKAYYILNDDFSLWAILSKEMFMHKSLGLDQISSVPERFLHYTRLATLFNCFVIELIGYSEGHNLFSNALLCLLFASCILIKRRILYSLFILLIVMGISMTYTPIFRSVYVDGLVSIIFACTISIYIQSENKSKAILYMVPLMFAMPNVKEVGYWLAYMSIGIIFIHLLLTKLINMRTSTGLLLLIIITFASHLLWQNYLGNFGLISSKSVISLNEFVAKLIESIISENEETSINIFIKIIKIFFVKEGSLITYILTLCILYFCNKSKIVSFKEIKTIYLSAMIVFVIYLLFRLSLFFVYPYYNSAVRYLGTYFILFAFIPLTYFKMIIEKELKIKSILDIIFMIIVAIIAIFPMYKGLKRQPLNNLSYKRYEIKKIADNLRLYHEGNSKTLTLFANFEEINCFQLNYEMSPNWTDADTEICSYQTRGLPTPVKLEKSVYESIKIENFNDLEGAKDPNKFDVIYIPFIDEEVMIELKKHIDIDTSHWITKSYIRKGEKFIAYE